MKKYVNANGHTRVSAEINDFLLISSYKNSNAISRAYVKLPIDKNARNQRKREHDVIQCQFNATRTQFQCETLCPDVNADVNAMRMPTHV